MEHSADYCRPVAAKYLNYIEDTTVEILGKSIKEVWDSRLSTAVPQINRDSGTWVVEIYSKTNPPDIAAEPLEVFDTGIVATPDDHHDVEKIIPCFQWLKSVRDNYALPDIEQRKELVSKIAAANKALADLGSNK